jgi:hypothetical protein
MRPIVRCYNCEHLSRVPVNEPCPMCTSVSRAELPDEEEDALSMARRLYAIAHSDVPGGRTQRVALMQVALLER